MASPAPPPRPRPRPPGFEPRYTLLLFYTVFFFFVFALLVVLPELLSVLSRTPPGPDQEALASEAARKALAGKVLPLFLLALATSAAGTYYRVLPGLRRG